MMSDSYSKLAAVGTNTASSRLVVAMNGWVDTPDSNGTAPDGMFGRKAIIKTWLVTLNSEELDFEFTVPFDDDTEANEAEIIVYNLSSETIDALRYNDNITIEAGYGDDTGLIFSGYIVSVKSKWDGPDYVTTIKALDNFDLKERDIVERTYGAGTKASFILNDLIWMLKIPCAVFSIRRDHTYKDEQKVSGGIMDNIRKYAEICGISVYINQGKIYARHLSEGDNINFTVSANTGMIESPEPFEEEVTAEDYTDVIKGYKVKMLLQHRLTTAAIVNLSFTKQWEKLGFNDNNKSKDGVVSSRKAKESGTYRVRSGKHTFNSSECITEVEVI